jgi:hypothetical protein
MKRSAGHLPDVGIVHVVVLNLIENFAVNGERAIGLFVVRASPNIPSGYKRYDNQRQYDDDFLG